MRGGTARENRRKKGLCIQPGGCAVLGRAGTLVGILQDRVAEFRVKKQEDHEDVELAAGLT